jgi:enoyl-CoA hydratase/carnithine racemase
MAQTNAAAGGGLATGREGIYGPPVAHRSDIRSDGISFARLDLHGALIITKRTAGFDRASIGSLIRLVVDACSGQLGALKFLVFDFAHPGEGEAIGAEGFEHLVGTVADMILTAPVVTVANARAYMAGADLEFALACSMLIGEQGTRFSFGADPVASVGLYGSLSQKIGFVRAERLMEGGEVLSAEQMRELLLMKEVAGDGVGLAGIDRFLRTRARKHNSCYALYRAQRIALPSIYQRLAEAKVAPVPQ